MANKMYEIAFRIAAAVDGRFNSAFMSAADKMSALEAKTRKLKSSMNNIDRMYSQRALTAAEYGKALAKVGNEIERNERLQKRYAAAQRLQDSAGKVSDKAKNAMAVSGAVGAVMLAPAYKAMSFETNMAGVAKQVDGARDEFGKLTDIGKAAQADIMGLSKNLMVAPDEIAKAYAFAARAGVKGTENLRKMTEMGVMMGTAFEMPREQVTQDMAEIANAMGYNLEKMEGIKALEALADRINYVDEQTIAKGQDLIDWMKRSSGIVKGLAGSMSENFQLGLGAGFLSTGVKTEQAETAVRNMLTKFAAPERESKDFHWALSQLEIIDTDLQESMINNADQTILKVFERLKGLDEGKRLNVMAELFGKEHIGTLSRLASNMDKFTDSIKVAQSEAAKGSMRKEFEMLSQTTARMWEGAQASLTRMLIDLGGALLPSLQEKVNALSGFAEKVGEFAKAHPELTSNVMVGTAAFAGWGFAVSAATWIISSAVGPLVSFTKWLIFSRVATDGTVIASRAAVAWTYIEMAGLYAKAGALKIVTAAQWLWNAALTANPIGLVIAGIAALVIAIVWLYHNWEMVHDFMVKLWDSPAFAVIAFLAGPVGLIIGAVVGIIANWDKVKAWFTLLWDDPGAALTQFIDMIMSKFGAAVKWLEEKWNQLKKLFGGGLGGTELDYSQVTMPGMPVAANALGGIYEKGAFLTTFAENSAEAAIPLDGSARAVSLWQQAGQMLGVSPGGGSVMHATFSPTIMIYGNPEPGQVQREVENANRSFLDYLHNERRLSFADE